MGGEIGELMANGLVNATTNAVASNGRLEDFFANYNGKTLFVARIAIVDEGNFLATDGGAVAVGVFNTTTGVKTVGLGEH